MFYKYALVDDDSGRIIFAHDDMDSINDFIKACLDDSFNYRIISDVDI